MESILNKKYALIIVDVQNDFCPGGALPVSEGDQIIPVLNKYIAFFDENNLSIFASRDWHPPNSKHFNTNGGKWPPHCIQNTWGAQFHSGLIIPSNTIILSKGVNPDEEGYSVFEGLDSQGRNIKDILNSMGIKTLLFGGLTTDYCVKISALMARKYGFEVVLLIDAVKGVDLLESGSQKAITEMVNKGVKLQNYKNFIAQ